MNNVGRAVLNPKDLVTDVISLDMKRVSHDTYFYENSNFQISKRLRSGRILQFDLTVWQVINGITCKLILDYDYVVPMSCSIEIERKRCNYGGWRFWFICPECEQRCRILYLTSIQDLDFACRICHNLTYRSQQWKPSKMATKLYAVLKYDRLMIEFNKTRSMKKRELIRKKASRIIKDLKDLKSNYYCK